MAAIRRGEDAPPHKASRKKGTHRRLEKVKPPESSLDNNVQYSFQIVIGSQTGVRIKLTSSITSPIDGISGGRLSAAVVREFGASLLQPSHLNLVLEQKRRYFGEFGGESKCGGLFLSFHSQFLICHVTPDMYTTFQRRNESWQILVEQCGLAKKLGPDRNKLWKVNIRI